MPSSTALNIITVIVGCVGLGILLIPRLKNSVYWRATVTPLASIIGSGFLIIVPLLGTTVGRWAWPAIAAVVALAYVVGIAIRYNIRFAEPLLKSPDCPRAIHAVEMTSDIALSASYFISVVFYLRLMSAFVLHAADINSDVAADGITTLILLFIGIIGKIQGLSALEWLEKYSVSIKLAIIGALLVGLGVYDSGLFLDGALSPLPEPTVSGFEAMRLIAGMLLIVQGFETSRYLGEQYSAELRIKTMRTAQIVAVAIYLAFVAIASPLMIALPSEVSETAIIELASSAIPVLGPMLILAAVMSQFSAAVADTVGAGGLIAEFKGRHIHLTSQDGYLIVALFGIALVWSADIFEIIALASRAFAIYYTLQAIVAFLTAHHTAGRSWRAVGFGVLAIVLGFVALVGKSVG